MIDPQKPLVSVLIPAYNHESYVREAILSVINQTYGYENIQLIVTDDCSKDDTVVILRELAAKYNFKLIVHIQNIGLSSTLNEMILLSEGKYVIIFASDDIMVLDRIEYQINLLKKNPDIDILAGDVILIDKEGQSISNYKQYPQSSLIDYGFEDLFLRLKPGFSAGSVIIKSDLFQRIGAYDPNYKIEDYYFWLKAAYNGAKIVRCNMLFLYYRVHQKSLSSDRELMDPEISKILSIYKSHPKYSKAILNHEITKLLRLGIVCKSEALRHLIKNPMYLFNWKMIKVLVMLILPSYKLKLKFPEYYYKHASN
jgi:alpha-1,3-rhamnosyltransferase